MVFSEDFSHKNETCYYCNGYYGPCFSQPVCASCHALLYPDDASQRLSIGPCQEKTDDGDSGNEEPKEPSDFHQMEQPENQDDLQQPPPPPPPVQQQQQQQLQLLPAEGGGAGGNRVPLMDDPVDMDFAEGAAAMPLAEPIPVEGMGPGGVNSGGPPGLSGGMPSRSSNGIGSSAAVGSIGGRCHFGGNISGRATLQEMINQLTCPRPPDNMDPSLIHRIPPEVLMVVFDLLDDMTLWSVDHVCMRWHNLVTRFVNEKQWEEFTRRRWPLFRPLYDKVPWQQVYTKLTESAPCQICLYQMLLPATLPANENSWRRNRLRNELRTLRSDPPEGIEASPLDEMSLHWQASIRGPAGSPYEGGTFFLYIQIPPSYPLSPPIVRFITKIFHPNVSRHGDIGIDSIQHNWSLALTISKVLISIQSLLTDPYTKVCMEPEIGRLYDSNKNLFERVAKAWTHRHAMHDGLIPDSPPSTFPRLSCSSDSPPSTFPRLSCSSMSQIESDDGIALPGSRSDVESAMSASIM